MRAAGIRRPGGDVEVLDLPEPRALAADEVLIEVAAAGIGNWDDLVRTGGWDVGVSPPMALGVQGVGRIVRVGGDRTGLAVGDEVMTHPLPLREQGTWAEQLIAPADLVARKPAGVCWEPAGAFPVPALTADQVVSGALGGETLLVHGAGGDQDRTVRSKRKLTEVAMAGSNMWTDGNALAGPLQDIFGPDVTAAVGGCGNCGHTGPMAGVRVFDHAPGVVARCPDCDQVLLRLVRGPGRAWLDMRGLDYLQLPMPDET